MFQEKIAPCLVAILRINTGTNRYIQTYQLKTIIIPAHTAIIMDAPKHLLRKKEVKCSHVQQNAQS